MSAQTTRGATAVIGLPLALVALLPVASAQEQGAAAGAPPAVEAPAQPTEADADWAAQVDRACTSRRYGLRLAAARRVGEAGDAAVPAVRDWQLEHGRDAVPMALVEAFVDRGRNGEAVLGLLEDWARDRDFYWRAEALRGLATRAADADLARRFAPLFLAHRDDPSWLARAYAALGCHLGRRHGVPGLDADEERPEPDPRAVTRFAALVGMPPQLLEALGDERTFLGVPWGRRRAAEAAAALGRVLGDDAGYRADASFAANADAIAELRRRCAEGAAATPPLPEVLTDPDVVFTGGVEVLSCRNGDLFVRWTADGRVSGHPTPVHREFVRIDDATWQELSRAATALELAPETGVVVCDRMRLQLRPDGAQAAIAPGSMPAPCLDWLKRLADAIEEAGGTELTAALRDRLEQFAAR